MRELVFSDLPPFPDGTPVLSDCSFMNPSFMIVKLAVHVFVKLHHDLNLTPIGYAELTRGAKTVPNIGAE
jgi:hypothetical protein